VAGLCRFLEGAVKLATLKSGGRDGTLVVVDRDLTVAVPASPGARTLQAALDGWERIAPRLEVLYADLMEDELDAFPLKPAALAAPLPRAYQWLDGSAYLSHVERVRRARGADMPPEFLVDPLMYQGGSARFLGPRDPIQIADPGWGPDFEAEVAVITDDVPQGVKADDAGDHIVLVVLVNDVSLRLLIPQELAKGFGFLHGKPGPAFSPVAVTPDELGGAWDGRRLHLPLVVHRNGEPFGRPDAGRDMQFDFPALIAHAAKTRPLPAGTVIGSGTVSNQDPEIGFGCIVERRAVETQSGAETLTPYLDHGESIRIEMPDPEGRTIFGAIEQRVEVRRS
jgi:fumarylacetoacetate (FAA) hydrolase